MMSDLLLGLWIAAPIIGLMLITTLLIWLAERPDREAGHAGHAG